jgi:glycosyltransferase involved in cell wall biosynthesis
MSKISLVINTLNEGFNIADCISSASKWVDEVIVCDMHSDDRTVEIAKSFQAKIVYHERTGFVEPARYYAISQASHEWVLVLDADEKLTDKLGEKLREIASENKVDAVSFASLFNYFGGYARHGGFFNNNWTRFFRKQIYLNTYSADELAVHQNFNALYGLDKNRKQTLSMEYYILHNAYPSIEKYVVKTIDFYARLEAKQKFERREKFSTVKMMYDFVKTFLMSYVVRRGFLDGVRGIILCLYYSVYRFNIWANLWFLEQQHNKTK